MCVGVCVCGGGAILARSLKLLYQMLLAPDSVYVLFYAVHGFSLFILMQHLSTGMS